MSYQITITNSYEKEKYKRPYNISPTIYNLKSEGEYIEDDKRLDDGTIQIPLYKRSGYLILPPGGIWTAETEDDNEVTYYKSMFLENVLIVISDKPGPGPEPGIDWESMVASVLWDSVDELIIPEGIKNEDLPDSSDSAWWQLTSVKKVVTPTSFEYIGSSFQDWTNLEEIVILPGPTAIYEDAFYEHTKLHSISIPNTVEYLQSGFASGCTSLTEITIPSSVTMLESNLFDGCNSLAVLKFESPTPITDPSSISEYTFEGIPETCKIYVPSGSLEAYTSAENYPDSSIYEYIEY